MKRVIRCSKCSDAAIKLGFGFTGVDELYCTERSCIVDKDDGCTFGTPGTPQTAVTDYNVTIEGESATNGCPW